MARSRILKPSAIPGRREHREAGVRQEEQSLDFKSAETFPGPNLSYHSAVTGPGWLDYLNRAVQEKSQTRGMESPAEGTPSASWFTSMTHGAERTALPRFL
ncbi:hypothetical protein AAFF_G00278740 [Aldrovandia affinis]|uniref:Uncharacterized protein n=1 Tax=Aldrovandia affinis TaxID=143900 RepID=A0AAD7SR85_9TELE|nr:hypothetical protein AAFF_G00278740 [Aldrovandia affinis]